MGARLRGKAQPFFAQGSIVLSVVQIQAEACGVAGLQPERRDILPGEGDRVGIFGWGDPCELVFDPLRRFFFGREFHSARIFLEHLIKPVNPPCPARAFRIIRREIVTLVVEVKAFVAQSSIRRTVKVNLEAAVQQVERLLLRLRG